MVWSIGCFTLATLLCGMAQSLEMLVLWRVVQGGTGAPVVPLSQTILLDIFPRRQHTMVLWIFGMAVAVAPVFGPMLGGYLAEAYSWRWSFYMLVPVGRRRAVIGMQLTLPADKRVTRMQARLDRLSGACDGARGGAARARARRAPRLVQLDRDHDRVPDRGGRASTYSSCIASRPARRS